MSIQRAANRLGNSTSNMCTKLYHNIIQLCLDYVLIITRARNVIPCKCTRVFFVLGFHCQLGFFHQEHVLVQSHMTILKRSIFPQESLGQLVIYLSIYLATPSYRSRVTLGDRSFQVAASALWNVLPREIRSITDLGIFKRQLKTHLFREAFY